MKNTIIIFVVMLIIIYCTRLLPDDLEYTSWFWSILNFYLPALIMVICAYILRIPNSGIWQNALLPFLLGVLLFVTYFFLSLFIIDGMRLYEYSSFLLPASLLAALPAAFYYILKVDRKEKN